MENEKNRQEDGFSLPASDNTAPAGPADAGTDASGPDIGFSHYSVMLSECIDGLHIKPDGLYLDLTAGGGGHSYQIASRLRRGGHLIAIDQDADAIRAVRQRLAPFGDLVETVQANFSSVGEVLAGRRPDGFLIDLGVSSYQLDTAERGFSYMKDAPLDMRMDQRAALSAFDVVNGYEESRLADLIFRYGEEKFARRIAALICEERKKKPVATTGELSALIKRAMPAKAKEGGHHPAKRTFQAIRIEVNGELDVIAPTLRTACEALNPGGRAVVITFHSLEDRIVKQTFAELEQGCICPRDFPVCVCGRKPVLRPVNRKPILPGSAELEENPRSRSAKLRIAERM